MVTAKTISTRLILAMGANGLFFLTGCSTWFEKNFIEPNYRPQAMIAGEKSRTIKHTVFVGEKTDRKPTGPYDLKFTADGQIDSDGSQLDQLFAGAQQSHDTRNFLAIQFMLVSDNLAERHKALLLGNYAVTNSVLGILISTAGGLAAIMKPATTKSALGAGAAVLNSTKSTLNSELFLNQLATTIVAAIDKERKKLRDAIEPKLKLKVEEYSIDQAMLDVQAYHDAGSFTHGLVVLSESLAKQRETAPEIEARIASLEVQLKKSIDFSEALPAAERSDAKAKQSILRTEIDLLRVELARAPRR